MATIFVNFVMSQILVSFVYEPISELRVKEYFNFQELSCPYTCFLNTYLFKFVRKNFLR